jgi:hypothetical protein
VPPLIATEKPKMLASEAVSLALKLEVVTHPVFGLMKTYAAFVLGSLEAPMIAVFPLTETE